MASGSRENDWGTGKIVAYGGSIVIAGGLFVVATPFVLSVAGFKTAGIVGGSLAAAMSISAIANGGGVPAGGVVATLQSVGAVGLGAKGAAAVGAAGASVWTGMTYIDKKIFRSSDD